MKVATMGIDLAKNVFSLHGVDAHGKVVLRKAVSRGKLLECFALLRGGDGDLQRCASLGAAAARAGLRSPDHCPY